MSVDIKTKNNANAAKTPITVITGGSDGIGRALADEFAQTGHRLLLVARNQEKLHAAQLEIIDAYGVMVDILSIDLSTSEGCNTLRDYIAEKDFYVDILVNNAGMGVGGWFVEQDRASILKMIDLNLRSCTELMTLFLPDMVARGQGGILNVASLAGMGPVPFLSVYAATKAYMVSLTKTVSEELRGTGVKMSVLAPGPVDTSFFEAMGNTPQDWIRKVFFLTPQTVARVGVNCFFAGQKIIVPGLLATAGQIGIKILPHNFVAFFYKRLALRISQIFPWS